MNIQENIAICNSASKFLAQEISEAILDTPLKAPLKLVPVENSGSSLILPLFDRTDSSKAITVAGGDICVAGTKEQRTYLIKIIQESVEQTQKLPVRSSGQFLKTLSKPGHKKKKKNSSNLGSIVEVDLGKIAPASLEQIVTHCNTSFVFQVEELAMYCVFSGKYRITGRASSLLKALGGEYLTRLHFMASLKDNEFMVIQGKNETIRVLR